MVTSVCEQCLDEHPETQVSPCAYEDCSVDVCNDCSAICPGVCQPIEGGCGHGSIQNKFCIEHFETVACGDGLNVCPLCYAGSCEIDGLLLCICPDCSQWCSNSNCGALTCTDDCGYECEECTLFYCENCYDDHDCPGS